ncbi:MAG: hypothetical protein CSH36_02805 [Thalassolituus sp.]|uniref:DUF3429 domain-containing protein n=1 Tax=Thalassolituus sp. TaxID=2030822 RepID=UPI0035173D3A|nr:MAG: hypothetical protein CSH36_02805 [Thalassolituus sp.]
MSLSLIRSMTLTQQLGYAGLLPFFFSLIAEVAGLEGAADIFRSYSVVILAFMAGACWGVGQVRPERRRSVELTLAIAVSLLAMLMYFMPLLIALPGLLVGYWTLVWLEREPLYRQAYRRDYRQLRWVLTVTVSACHLLLIWLLLR